MLLILDAKQKLGEWKPVLWNENTNDFATPHGTMGSRWDNEKKWNLRLEDEEEQVKRLIHVFLYLEWKIVFKRCKFRTSLMMETQC